MKKVILHTIMSLVLLIFYGCSNEDETVITEDLVVAFENPALSFDSVDSSKEVKIIFSTEATESGTLTLTYTAENAVYGEDFTTTPTANNGNLTLDFEAGANGVSFTFNKLKDAIEGTSKNVSFEISSITTANAYANGNTALVVSFTEIAAPAGTFSPEVGGPNEPNQVYVDLSSLTETAVKRDSWDLAFYSGSEFRVKINGSIFMAAAELDATDIDAVTPEDVADIQAGVAVGTFNPANTAYIDGVEGDITTTAIAEISETDDDNKVYLVNLGNEIGTETPDVGRENINGEARGWMKIRILKDGNDYKLHYAALDATTHNEATISKASNNDFTFFSLIDGNTVDVAPAKGKWDFQFTPFTNVITGFGSYGYADFIITNSLNNVQAYEVETSIKAYADFTAADVDETSFIAEQRAIGANWRNGGGPNSLPSLRDDVYFIVKDADENVYKVRFTAFTSESGVRGNPAFEFELL